jgi:tRNA(adenine34) deaminase
MALLPQDEAPMRAAIAASRDALEAGDMPFGATLVDAEGRLRWTARNDQNTKGDCTRHAETALVRDATVALGPAVLEGATVYASGEPCAMCAGAMYWAGVRRIVFAASQPEIGATLGGLLLPIRTAQTLAGASHPVQVEGPLLGGEALAVLRDWAARQPAAPGDAQPGTASA